MVKNLSYLLCFVSFVLAGCGANLKPEDIKTAMPKQAVEDARKMINEKKLDKEKYKNWIYPAQLPESLRLKGLIYAMVYDDHVNLVLARNPDWLLGARIWGVDATRKHEDKKTKYPDIFFFQYCNDSPESAGNLK